MPWHSRVSTTHSSKNKEEIILLISIQTAWKSTKKLSRGVEMFQNRDKTIIGESCTYSFPGCFLSTGCHSSFNHSMYTLLWYLAHYLRAAVQISDTKLFFTQFLSNQEKTCCTRTLQSNVKYYPAEIYLSIQYPYWPQETLISYGMHPYSDSDPTYIPPDWRDTCNQTCGW